MKGQICMFFTPPKLSDEAAYELMEFVQNFAVELESHFMHQLRRHSEVLDEEFQKLSKKINNVKDDEPLF